MRSRTQVKNTTLTPALEEYIQEKLIRPLERLFSEDEMPILDVEIELTTRHHKKGPVWRAEANFSLGKVLLRAEHFGEDVHEAIDLVEEEIMREVKKFREKMRTKERSGARIFKNIIRKFRRQ